jgi:hypothetical protein
MSALAACDRHALASEDAGHPALARLPGSACGHSLLASMAIAFAAMTTFSASMVASYLLTATT